MQHDNIILALDSDQVSRLAHIPKSTLAYWERTGVFGASHIDPQPRVPFRRIYSFRDVVSLRALSELRRNLRVSLGDLRSAGAYLSQFYKSPWSELRFGVVDKRLVFWDLLEQRWRGMHGQHVLPIDFSDLPSQVAQEALDIARRSPDQIGKITRNRYVHRNAWVIAGTRIPTSTIRAFHEDGYNIEDILDEYPQLTPADVTQALAHEYRTTDAA